MQWGVDGNPPWFKKFCFALYWLNPLFINNCVWFSESAVPINTNFKCHILLCIFNSFVEKIDTLISNDILF